RVAIRARDSHPRRLSRASMRRRGVRRQGGPRFATHAWKSIHGKAQRKRPFFGFADAVRSGQIPLVSRRAKFVSDISRDYCRERRRRNHGVAPSPIPSARSAIPSGIRTHTRRQENSREFPRACSRNRDERSQLTLRMKARIKSVHSWPTVKLRFQRLRSSIAAATVFSSSRQKKMTCRGGSRSLGPTHRLSFKVTVTNFESPNAVASSGSTQRLIHSMSCAN